MTERLDRVRQTLREFVAEREWEQFHDPKNLAMAVVSEAGELAAEYRWLRSDEVDEWSAKPENRERVAAEAADVGIASVLLHFARWDHYPILDCRALWSLKVDSRNAMISSSGWPIRKRAAALPATQA